LGDSEQCI